MHACTLPCSFWCRIPCITRAYSSLVSHISSTKTCLLQKEKERQKLQKQYRKHFSDLCANPPNSKFYCGLIFYTPLLLPKASRQSTYKIIFELSVSGSSFNIRELRPCQQQRHVSKQQSKLQSGEFRIQNYLKGGRQSLDPIKKG